MSRFDEDEQIEDLPAEIHKELVGELNKASAWKVLAEYVAEEFGCFSTKWIQGLEREAIDGRSRQTPAQRLLFELNTKNGTVGMLCGLLRNCALLDALSILHYPEPLMIEKQPGCEINGNKVAIGLGENFCLRCEAKGLPPPRYVWFHGDVELEEQNSDKLNIMITNPMQEGEYKCRISHYDREGQLVDHIFSDSVFVEIESTAVVVEKQPPAFIEVTEGDDFTLSCEVKSHPKPRYQWYRDNTKLDGHTSNILHITKFNAKDEGRYYCYIKNEISDVFTQKSHAMMELPRQKAVAKIALLIANSNYEKHKELRSPQNDAAKIARLLSQIGFKVICLQNLTLVQMKNAMKIFCQALSEGVYGLFYYAGHGFKMQESYMMPIDCPEVYLRKDAICESQLLAMVLQGDPALLAVILDMCQTVPSKESNPGIHSEVPNVDEYKGSKNLRNLIQAYSTSSHRPSYERTGDDCGLYVTHLAKHIDKDIPVTRVFEEVGKSIDTWLEGKERNQIPMVALTVTKPYRLTDATQKKNKPPAIAKLEHLIAFPTKTVEMSFEKSRVHCQVGPFMEPYLNVVKVTMLGMENWEVNFNALKEERLNFVKIAQQRACRICNPQTSKMPLIISLHKNGALIGAMQLPVMKYVPAILQELDILTE